MDLKTIDSVSTESPWVNIPDELLELIINHLTLYDRCHSQLVCRRWYSTIHAIPPYNGLSYGLPCQVSIDEDGKACTLVDPFCNKMHIKCSNLPSQSYILCSKGEWLLMSGDQWSIFFFNPLTTTRIDLPDRDNQGSCVYGFSSPPTSTDCLVIGYYSYSGETITFLCRRGQKEWTCLEDIENETEFDEAYVNPTFYQGTFYCLSFDGALALFDSCESVWSFIPIPEGPEPIITAYWKTEVFMAQFNEELFLVFIDQSANSVKIYKLDPSARRWKDADNIGDRSLFVGRGTSICSEANALIGGNKIYFPRIKDGVYLSYSCGERKFHPDGNFYGSRVCQLSFWMEPAWFKYSHEELKWSE